METHNDAAICQSCGMPLAKDPNGGGTNADQTQSNLYCGFCYQNGQFTDEGVTLAEKIEKNVRIAVARLNVSEQEARQMAERILPNLKRWRRG